jgi:hypothetical protein
MAVPVGALGAGVRGTFEDDVQAVNRARRQPDLPPPGLPTLREFQAAQGRTALAWLKICTTWR